MTEADAGLFGTRIMKTHLVETERDKDIIFGNLDPNLLQIDTPQGIYDRCREIIRGGSKVPGGFMLAPGCSIPATAPPVNVYALTRAARDFSAT